MTDIDILKLLKRIDRGYQPTKSEIKILSMQRIFKWESEYNSVSSRPERLPDSIGLLTNLTELYLSNVRLECLPEEIGTLKNLQCVDLCRTFIGSLPDSFMKLTNLRQLNLRHADLDSLSESIRNLRNLEVLDLSYNPLSSLPQGLWGLQNLKELYIAGINVNSLPDEIGHLPMLKRLVIEDLELSEIPESLLNLEVDFIQDFSFLSLEYSGVFIGGTKLTNQPIEIFDQSRELIQAYYEERKVPINECKVIFLGDAEAGKTLSIKRLLRKGALIDDYNSDATPGIDITISSTEVVDSEIVINYWDFGGQEIQHSMHRMFLTERTVYVVFLNARQDPLDEKARYWMENIRSFAPKSPVLLIINKIDQNDRPTFNEERIRKDYGNQIRDVVRMSALKDEPEHFLKQLQGGINSIIKDLPSVKEPVPKSWKSLMWDIRNMPDYYLTNEQFSAKCHYFKIKNYKNIHDNLVNLYQTIGVSFCYYKDRSLAEYLLLNPKWLVNALYTIITNSEIVTKNGVITQDDLYDLLKKDTIHGIPVRRVSPDLRYDGIEVNYILGVTRMFRISFRLQDGSEFFPMLCDGNEKISVFDVVSKNALHYIFRYVYLPSNVLHRLIVEMQRDLDNKYVWYSGAVFRNDEIGQIAYIYFKGNELHIFVESKDEFYNPNEYLTPIQKDVRDISREMNLTAEEYVTYRENDIETAISFDELKGNLESRIYRGYNKEIRKVIDFRDVARRYRDKRPKMQDELLMHIINALCSMQNDITYYRNDSNSHDLENSRNRFVSALLRAAGYDCSDQQTGGISTHGNYPGERDILIKNKKGQDFLIYEGMNLKRVDALYIDKHLEKLIENYNPQGFPYGVLVSYLDCERSKFKSIVDEYMIHIANYPPKDYLAIGNPVEIRINEGQYLNCIEMNYECGNLYFTIYHIVVRVAS